jgi:hypothetical protein
MKLDALGPDFNCKTPVISCALPNSGLTLFQTDQGLSAESVNFANRARKQREHFKYLQILNIMRHNET